MPKNSNQTIVLGGDFNLPGIDWDKFIPTKMTSPRENLPWLSKSLLASIWKKTSLYNKAKRTNKADL